MRAHSETRRNVEQFVRGYVEAALWSTMDESDAGGGRPLDENFGPADIARSSLKSMRRECARFLKQNRRQLAAYGKHLIRRGGSSSSMERAGRDFWLTRNGHGAGFWSRDYDAGQEDVGDRLTVAAHRFGASDLYVGDDGHLYVSPER